MGDRRKRHMETSGNDAVATEHGCIDAGLADGGEDE